MANLLPKGEDVGPIILRTVRRAALVGDTPIPSICGIEPRTRPGAFGEQWREAAAVIPWVALSTLILGSISVATSGYLSALGSPGLVAWATAAFGVVWIAVTAPLLPVLGVAAIGVGNLCGGLAEHDLRSGDTAECRRVAPYRPLLLPLAVALFSGAWAGSCARLAHPASVTDLRCRGADSGGWHRRAPPRLLARLDRRVASWGPAPSNAKNAPAFPGRRGQIQRLPVLVMTLGNRRHPDVQQETST